MTGNGKLPISIQLVWGTSAVIFVTSALQTYMFSFALSRQWEAVHTITRNWSELSFLFSPIVEYALLAVISLVTFSVISIGERASLFKVSIFYLAGLMIVLDSRIYIHLPGGSIHGLLMASRTSQLYFGLRVLYAMWLIGLLVAVLPNYSFNATVMSRRENPAPGAAPSLKR